MAKTQIQITDENEIALRLISVTMAKNQITCSSKGHQINFAIEKLEQLISSLDSQSLYNLTGLKK